MHEEKQNTKTEKNEKPHKSQALKKKKINKNPTHGSHKKKKKGRFSRKPTIMSSE